MDNTAEKLTEAIRDYEAYARDVTSSSNSTFENALQRFLALVDVNEPIGLIASATLPDVDFDEFYEKARATVKSMAGSGNLDWPTDKEIRVALQLELLRRIASGQLKVHGICHDFMYAGKNLSSNLRLFLSQVFRPFVRDFSSIVQSRAGQSRRAALANALSNTPQSVQPSGAEMKFTESTDPKSVFVVHGRNLKAATAMLDFLTAIRLDPQEWPKAVAQTGEGTPFTGDVVEKGIRDCQAVVVLLTGDDLAYLHPAWQSAGDTPEESKPMPQPRANVIFEAGHAFGVSRQKTIIVTLRGEKLRGISDLHGRHVIQMDDSPEQRNALVERLRSAGCDLDTSGRRWLGVGDFEGAVVPPETVESSSTPMEAGAKNASLSDEELSVLVYLAEAEEEGLDTFTKNIARGAGISKLKAQYVIDQLSNRDMVDYSSGVAGIGLLYHLTDSGRALLIEQGHVQ